MSPTSDVRRLRLAGGLNSLVFVLIALGIFVMLNYLSARRLRWQKDVTPNKRYTISDRTKNILKNLEKDVTVLTIFRGDRLSQETQELLDQFKIHTPRLKVEALPHEDRAKAEARLKKTKQEIRDYNTLIFECGDRTKVVLPTDLAEQQMRNPYQPPEPPKFKGEQALVSALLTIIQEKQITVYFTKGHGEAELSAHGRDGLSELEKLLKQDNIKTGTLELFRTPKVPDDSDLVVIPGPTKRFLPEEINALEGYLQAQGNLMVFFEPFKDETGLEQFTKDWGIEVRQDIIIDPRSRTGDTAVITSFPLHKIVDKMKDLPLLLRTARTLKLEAQVTRGPRKMKTASLADSTGETWTKNWTEALQDANKKPEDPSGPFTLAAISEEEGDPRAPKKARLIVVGDASLLGNTELIPGFGPVQPPHPGAETFFLNSVYYCVSREEMIDIPPRSIDPKNITAKDEEVANVKLASLLGMPAFGVVLGLVVWLVRRR